MAQLLVGIVLVLQAHYVRPEYFTDEFALLPVWPRFDAARALWLFGITMLVLLAPKIFGLMLALADGPTRRGSGGGVRMVMSTLLGIVFSALLAPIMMVMQTGAVLRIILGKDAGWHAQRRDEWRIPFRAMVRRHFSHMLLGLMALVAGLLIAPSLVGWMSPTIAGLLLAAVLSWGTGQLSAGLVLKHWRILLTPEETKPPPIASRARAVRAALNDAVGPATDALRAIHVDRELREMHTRFLPPPVGHVRGEISSRAAVASAKLDDALSLEDVVAWLSPKERMALLHDRSLIAKFAGLPNIAPSQRTSGQA
jgi:membrane glycosyltransferase